MSPKQSHRLQKTEQGRTRGRVMKNLRAFENVLRPFRRVDVVILSQIIPHITIFVAPFTGPRIPARHSPASEHIQPVYKICTITNEIQKFGKLGTELRRKWGER